MSSADKTKASLSKEAKLTSELAAILDDRNLSDIEVETETMSVRVSRTVQTQIVAAPAAAPAAAVAAPAAPAQTPAAEKAPAGENLADHPGALKSPMVGTYYEGPEPGAPAFVKEGDTVKKGQTVCILEAMKVMNPITANKDGTVTHIACENGQPIEYDQLLLVIE